MASWALPFLAFAFTAGPPMRRPLMGCVPGAGPCTPSRQNHMHLLPVQQSRRTAWANIGRRYESFLHADERSCSSYSNYFIRRALSAALFFPQTKSADSCNRVVAGAATGRPITGGGASKAGG